MTLTWDNWHLRPEKVKEGLVGNIIMIQGSLRYGEFLKTQNFNYSKEQLEDKNILSLKEIQKTMNDMINNWPGRAASEDRYKYYSRI